VQRGRRLGRAARLPGRRRHRRAALRAHRRLRLRRRAAARRAARQADPEADEREEQEPRRDHPTTTDRRRRTPLGGGKGGLLVHRGRRLYATAARARSTSAFAICALYAVPASGVASSREPARSHGTGATPARANVVSTPRRAAATPTIGNAQRLRSIAFRYTEASTGGTSSSRITSPRSSVVVRRSSGDGRR